MLRVDALQAIYPDLEQRIVVTIMGAVAAELYTIGHRHNFFYLEHAMGLASSIGLGIAIAMPAHNGPLQTGKPAAHRLRQRKPALCRRLSNRHQRRHRPRWHRQVLRNSQCARGQHHRKPHHWCQRRVGQQHIDNHRLESRGHRAKVLSHGSTFIREPLPVQTLPGSTAKTNKHIKYT